MPLVILADVNIPGCVIPLIVIGLVLILLAALLLVSEDSSYSPSGRDRIFHFGFWDILLLAGCFMVFVPVLYLFSPDTDLTMRNRYGRTYNPLHYLALVFAFLCHAGVKSLLKKWRQKWAREDLEKRRKKSGNKSKKKRR